MKTKWLTLALLALPLGVGVLAPSVARSLTSTANTPTDTQARLTPQVVQDKPGMKLVAWLGRFSIVKAKSPTQREAHMACRCGALPRLCTRSDGSFEIIC
jgi:hypothetical protein